jgi:hypothetical protein
MEMLKRRERGIIVGREERELSYLYGNFLLVCYLMHLCH